MITNIPKQYSEWCECLNIFLKGENDEEIIELMNKGIIELAPALMDKFIKKIGETFNLKLDNIVNSLNKNLAYVSGEEAYVSVLSTTRRKFNMLRRFSIIKIIPNESRKLLLDALDKTATNLQNSLLDGTKADKSGYLNNIIKKYSLENYYIKDESKKSVDKREPKNKYKRRVMI